MSSGIIDIIKKVAENEAKKILTPELGIVTSVFSHSNEGDKDNYECNVKLKDKDLELRRVPVATQHVGLANTPHVGDLVLVTFVNGDINLPVIIGRLYNDEDRPPASREEEIVYKPQYSKNTDLNRIKIELPANDVKINLHDDRIEIESVDITIQCKGNVKIESEGDLDIKARNISMESQFAMKLKAGGAIEAEANTSMTMKSTAVANFESGAVMTIKGALVKIN
jgi:uncharacterized protein involved in type VI secretion and phage assembly